MRICNNVDVIIVNMYLHLFRPRAVHIGAADTDAFTCCSHAGTTIYARERGRSLAILLSMRTSTLNRGTSARRAAL